MSNTSVKYISFLISPLLTESFMNSHFTITVDLAQAPGRKAGLWFKYKYIFQ